jgi:ubiquinone biosynthesis protein
MKMNLNPSKLHKTYVMPLKTLANTAFKAQVLKQNQKDIAKWLSSEFTSLGPTYIKIGQFISSRGDVFGKEFSQEFDKLRDTVEPLTDDQLDEILSKSKLTKYYHSIDRKAIATASIGQVHRGIVIRKNKKRDVVIKVKRPDVENDIKQNLDFIMAFLHMFKKFNMENIDDTIHLVTDFKANILKEIDFENEFNNAVLFSKNNENDLIKIPRVVKTLSNHDIITMEYIPSIPINKYTGDKKEFTKKLINAFIEQLVRTGTIHGDPHSGNIGITKDNKIVLYDFGNIICISFQDRQYFKELLNYLMVGNKPAIIATLEKLKIEVTDKDTMNTYIDAYIKYIKTLNLNELKPLAVQAKNVKIPFKLTGDFFRLVRVFGILEGLCKELDPEFNYTDVLETFSTEILFDTDFMMYKTNKDLSTIMNLLNVITNTTSHLSSM